MTATYARFALAPSVALAASMPKLAVLRQEKLPELSDFPTAAETGIPGFIFESCKGTGHRKAHSATL